MSPPDSYPPDTEEWETLAQTGPRKLLRRDTVVHKILCPPRRVYGDSGLALGLGVLRPFQDGIHRSRSWSPTGPKSRVCLSRGPWCTLWSLERYFESLDICVYGLSVSVTLV